MLGGLWSQSSEAGILSAVLPLGTWPNPDVLAYKENMPMQGQITWYKVSPGADIKAMLKILTEGDATHIGGAALTPAGESAMAESTLASIPWWVYVMGALLILRR